MLLADYRSYIKCQEEVGVERPGTLDALIDLNVARLGRRVAAVRGQAQVLGGLVSAFPSFACFPQRLSLAGERFRLAVTNRLCIDIPEDDILQLVHL